MSFPLNQQQAKAVTEFQADLLVTAGAGTGKTSVLTNKFLRLLTERRATVDEIVAITFTNKAATEMRNRIDQGIRTSLKQATDPLNQEYWKTQLAKLANARICTFHSLCLGLIQTHPLEAGVPPVTTILDQGETSIYLNQTVEQVLLQLSQATGPGRQILTKMLLDFGWNPFVAALGEVYQTIRESGQSFTTVTKISEVNLATATGQLPANLLELGETIGAFLDYTKGMSLTEHAAEVVELLRENWQHYSQPLIAAKDAETALTILGELRRGLPGNLPASIKSRVLELQALIDGHRQRIINQEALSWLPVLGQLLQQIEQTYAQMKSELGALDFTDHLVLARNLLRNHSELATEVQQGLGYLLVDEFQDTNSLQLEIIDLLRGQDYQGGRMMAVGDIKQSIYRFRGAEADLIQDLEARFRAEQGEVIPLTQNYRSGQMVINFINQVCSRLFIAEPFEYQPLETADSSSLLPIELILTGDQDKAKEARMVARRIKALVAEATEPGPVNYGEIVMLFRASTAMGLYQQALQELGIPFYTASGSGFYRCQEVADQLNLLRLVEQGFDGVALLGLLKSPYVSLSDQSLFWLSSGQDLVEQFYERADFSDRISLPERQRLAEFRALIIQLQERRESLRIVEVLRLALAGTHYQEVLWSMPNPSQRLANLEKLLAKAEEFAAKGFHDLHRFLEYIAKLEEVEVLEAEAQTQTESGNAVRLMTIHRAKGLEFPVVVLPDLDRRFPTERGRLIFHKTCGLGFTISDSEGEIGKPSLWEDIKRCERRESLAELKRVFYVALTRSKQRLILAGSGCSRSKGNTLETASDWMKWLELLIPIAEANDLLDYHGVPLKIIRELPAPAVPSVATSLLDVYAGRFDLNDFNPTNSKQEVAVTAQRDKATQVLKVSEFLAFQDCPRRYFWEYRWQLREHSGVKLGRAGDNHGTLIGSFLHQAARLGSSNWPEALWELTASSIDAKERDRIQADLRQIWVNFRQSRFTEQAGQHRDEVAFRLKLDPDLYIEGRLDRLIRTPAGELILVDYKTHRVTEQETSQIAKGYFGQLQIYALAVKALWGRLPNEAVFYFPYPDAGINVPLDQAALEQLKTVISRMADFIGSHDEPQAYAGTGHCEGCSYNWLCSQLD